MNKMKKLTLTQLASDAIDLFIEYRDQHGYDEAISKEKAINEIFEYEYLCMHKENKNIGDILSRRPNEDRCHRGRREKHDRRQPGGLDQ